MLLCAAAASGFAAQAVAQGLSVQDDMSAPQNSTQRISDARQPAGG
jgi:hypothetical protein